MCVLRCDNLRAHAERSEASMSGFLAVARNDIALSCLSALPKLEEKLMQPF
jgi:hypothetical protein